MEQKPEQSLFTSTKNWNCDDEQLTGDNCPLCGFPIVLEDGLEVCYRCGWYRGMEDNDTNF